MENVRLIPNTYRRANTFTHTFFKRGEHALIYKVILDTSFGSKKANPVYFEVFKRKIGKGGMVKFPGGIEKMVEPFESKPGDNSFGSWAWAVVGEKEAIDLFNKIEAAKGDLKLINEALEEETSEEEETEETE